MKWWLHLSYAMLIILAVATSILRYGTKWSVSSWIIIVAIAITWIMLAIAMRKIKK